MEGLHCFFRPIMLLFFLEIIVFWEGEGGGSDLYSFLIYTKVVFVSFLFVWVRDTIPQFRYKLMYLTWKRFLPLSLTYV